MADEQPQYHPRDEINDYVRRNYAELGEVKDKDIAIGVGGGFYRVMIKDAFQITHTLKIDPKSIDQDKAIKARVERIEVKRATNKPQEKTKDHDRERDR